VPVPAITGIFPFASSTATFKICFLSSSVIVGDSPVVPNTTIPETLFSN